MQIKGQHVFNNDPTDLWRYLTDPKVLTRITPGVESMEEDGPDRYRIHSRVIMGPVNGLFDGHISLKDTIPPKSFVLAMEQKSKMGNVTAEITIQLDQNGSTDTTIRYAGEARLSGLLSRMGQRVLGGVLNSLTKQFFAAFKQYLESNNHH